MTKNDEIRIEDIINEDWKEYKSIFDTQWSLTTLFLAPIIVDLNSRLDIAFVLKNIYLKDCKKENVITRSLFFLCKIKDFKASIYQGVQSFFRYHKNFIEEYDVGIDEEGNNLVMFVLSISDEYKDDYYNFKLGKYNSLSEKLKSKYTQKIISYTSDSSNKEYVENIAYHVSNKTDEIKKRLKKIFNIDDEILSLMEGLWDCPIREKEYYRYVNK